MGLKKLFLFCLLAVLQAQAVNAQWVDVTDDHLTNPSFDSRNTFGWEVAVDGYQNGGYQSASYNNGDSWISGFIEVWYPSWTLGDGALCQTVVLPKGSYRLHADCIASWQGNSSVEVEGVYLFAQTAAGLYTEPLATGSGAPEKFTVEFVNPSEGEVTLGVMINSTNANWVAADNFRLELSPADIVAARSVTITGGKNQLTVDEELQLGFTIQPANATSKKVEWSSSNEQVLTVTRDGLVTANAAGTATVYATATDGSGTRGRLVITVRESTASARNLVVNEVMSMNIDQFVDPSWNYGGWIELYNPADEGVSLKRCYITDDPAEPCKFPLENAGAVGAKGYKVIWFDHHSKDVYPTQVDFKLNTEGGWIAITSASGEVMMEQTYPAGVARSSWARTKDGGSEWGFTSQATPNGSNNGSPFAATRLAAPTVDVEAHLFTSPVTVHAKWPEGSTLRYTLDGSAPTATNGETSEDGVFYFDWGYNTLRLAAVQDGFLSSPVVTNTYIYKEHDFTIPVMAVSGTDDDLFSDQMGVLVQGTNGVAGGNNWVMNVYQDWDRPVVFEYFAPSGERIFCQDVNISAAGGWSRAYGQHTSFKLKASKVYEGKNSLDYPFFAEKPYLKHKTLQIRNGGNDSGCRFTDAGVQQVIGSSGIYVDYQAYQPVFHYINGRFGSVYNMREPNNKHHAYANYGLDTDLMDQFELTSHPVGGNYYEQMVGTKDTLNLLLELSAQCEDPVIYKRICDELLDIDEFINYMAVEIWMGCSDWITNSNNIKGFRSTEGDGRFHFVMLDQDSPFSNRSMASSATWAGNEVGQLWSNMLQNPDFRKKFIDTFSMVCGSVFEPERCKKVLDRMYSNVEPMMNLSGESAWSSYNSLRYNFGNGDWNRDVLYNNTQGFGRLYEESQRPVNVSFAANVPQCSFLYNGMDVPTGKFTGRAFLPVTITACTVPGYDFVGWRGQDGNVVLRNEVTLFDESTEWAYYDRGSLDGENWKSSSYNDNGWDRGDAPLGYAKDGLNTVLDYGGDSGNKYPTYYFRKTVRLDKAPADNDVFTLQYTIDDGFVIYVNGTEAARYNMYDGDVWFDDLAISYAPNNPDRGTITLPASLFKRGNNVIAVEIHNNSANSTDIMWAATLKHATREITASDFVSADPVLELNEGMEGFELVAVYTPSAASSPAAVCVNEVSAGNSIYVNDYFKKDDWIELYNTTDEAIDVAGMYLSDDAEAPQKFQIPANDLQQTVIEPHGHLVVWASKRNNFGQQVHTNFKLSNTDGQVVVLTSEDGAWSSKIMYNAHDGKESVGLYPDGGNDVYQMQRPSIEKHNTLTSYAQYLYTQEHEAVPDDGERFTLKLSEGWNWVSHPLARNIAATEINTNAQRIVSQTSETANVGGNWMGGLTTLNPGSGYKVLMEQDRTSTFTGPFCEPLRGVYLHKGWNWVGYTQLASQSVASALSNFTPSEGDVLMGRTGFATYENGVWSGSLDVLQAGAGYMYKSAAPKSLRFAEATTSAQPAPRFRVQPRTPWSAVDALYPNVMGVVAQVDAAGSACADDQFSIGAFSLDGECRGVGRWIDGRLFLTIYGNADEMIVFKAADATTGIVYDVTEQYPFASEVLGSRMNPVTLHMGEATDIASTKAGAGVLSVAYYNMGGLYAGSAKQQLGKGVYVMKCKLDNGKTITKKTIIK